MQRFTVHRLDQCRASPRSHGMPCRDVERRVHVSVGSVVAGNAPEDGQGAVHGGLLGVGVGVGGALRLAGVAPPGVGAVGVAPGVLPAAGAPCAGAVAWGAAPVCAPVCVVRHVHDCTACGRGVQTGSALVDRPRSGGPPALWTTARALVEGPRPALVERPPRRARAGDRALVGRPALWSGAPLWSSAPRAVRSGRAPPRSALWSSAGGAPATTRTTARLTC